MPLSVKPEQVIQREEGVFTLNVPPSGLVAYMEWDAPMIGVIATEGKKTLSKRPEYEVIRFHTDDPDYFPSSTCDGTPTPATTKDMLETAQWARAMAEKWRVQITHEGDTCDKKCKYFTNLASVYQSLADNLEGEENWLQI